MRKLLRPQVSIARLKTETNRIEGDWKPEPPPFKPELSPRPWRTPQVLGMLLAMHGRCCAYCQTGLTPSDRGDVEHFRPKSVYWWFAYDFENYLLSCARCNRVRKGSRFPLADREPRLCYKDGRGRSTEKRLLLDPAEDDVEEWIVVKLQGSTWRLRPKSSLAPGSDEEQQVSETIRFFGFNLSLLPKYRTEFVDRALKAAKQVKEGHGDTLDVRMMASRYAPYGIIVRKVLAPKFSNLLPTPIDEASFLAADLHRDLKSFEEILREEPGDEDTLTQQKIARWALATLWKYPPKGVAAAKIERLITNANRKDEIQPFYDKL